MFAFSFWIYVFSTFQSFVYVLSTIREVTNKILFGYNNKGLLQAPVAKRLQYAS